MCGAGEGNNGGIGAQLGDTRALAAAMLEVWSRRAGLLPLPLIVSTGLGAAFWGTGNS